jgi:16S rRNA (guanine527-N7)-methyltransferase
MSLSQRLRDGLTAMQLELAADQQEKLLAYLALLVKWNRTYNLTAIRDEGEMVTQHLLDSLSLLPALNQSVPAGAGAGAGWARRWADVGSGAGLPGIPLAISRPDLEMTLIETVEKKSAFQRQAKIELALNNLTILGGRVEDVAGARFDSVVSRAFAEIADFVRLAGHLLVPGGRLYAMKGVMPADEIARLPAGWAVSECVKLAVPGLNAQRHLIVLEKV